MVRMKLSRDEFDAKALDVKVEKSTFKRYRGEIPRNGTILIFRVTRMWWTQSKQGDSQIYLMAFAEGNKGALKQFNGLPVREYLTFIPEAAFRYQNFLQNFGLTTKDIFNRMDVEPEPDSIGDVINSIGPWVVGSDDALCRIALVRDRYDPDELKAKVDRDGWLPLDEDDEPEDVDDEDDEDDDDDEDDEPPARPARRSRTAAKPAATRSRRRSEPEPEDDDDEDDEDDEDDDEDGEEGDIDAEEEDQEEEGQEEDDDDEPDEPPARTRRSRDTGRTAARTRPAASGRRGAGTSGRRDGERTRTSRASTARTDRTVGPRGSKGRDGGSREDPPF